MRVSWRSNATMNTGDEFILLRHARAGRKVRDRAKDFRRPLDRRGRQVALMLPELIVSFLDPTTILSSPFRRCEQTVEPLAKRLGLAVVVDDGRFTPNRSPKAVRKGFTDVGANSVVCTHGEVIAGLFDEPVSCAKGAFWIVERRGDKFVPSRYVEAPKSALNRVLSTAHGGSSAIAQSHSDEEETR